MSLENIQLIAWDLDGVFFSHHVLPDGKYMDLCLQGNIQAAMSAIPGLSKVDAEHYGLASYQLHGDCIVSLPTLRDLILKELCANKSFRDIIVISGKLFRNTHRRHLTYAAKSRRHFVYLLMNLGSGMLLSRILALKLGRGQC